MVANVREKRSIIFYCEINLGCGREEYRVYSTINE
jgi:hypothetical protein